MDFDGYDWRHYSFLAGVLILIFTVLRLGTRRRVRSARRQAERQRQPTRPPAGGYGASASDQLGHLLVQLQEAGREIEGRLDTRIQYANRLLGELEETGRQLEQLLASVRAAGVAVPAVGGAGEAEAAGEDGLFQTRSRPQESPAATGDVAESAPATTDPQEERIAELAAEGRDADAIAAELDRPAGEIKLILSLIRAKNRKLP